MQMRITIANRQPPAVTTRSRMNNSRAISAGTKPLRKMAEPIEVIPVPAEIRFDPGEERHARIGIMPADAKQHDVQRDQGVDQSRKAKVTVGRDEEHGAEDAGSDFEPPGQAVVGAPTGPGKNQRGHEEQREVERRDAGVHFCQRPRRVPRRAGSRRSCCRPARFPRPRWKSSAVIRAGARERKAEGDIHAFMEGVEFQWDQALIVIHAKDSVEFPLHGAMENGIR